VFGISKRIKVESSTAPGTTFFVAFASQMSVPQVSAKSRNKVKKDAFDEFIHVGQTKHRYNLKPLQSKKLPKSVNTVDSKYMSCNEAYSQILSTPVLQDDGCRVSLDDHLSVEELCVPSQINSEQKTTPTLLDTASAADSQQPFSGICLPSVVPTHFKAATKKDQFRKMRDYHNYVIKNPTYIHQHAMTGHDAVKYLEHRHDKV